MKDPRLSGSQLGKVGSAKGRNSDSKHSREVPAPETSALPEVQGHGSLRGL